jgi:tetratricopeptide (TPR) repeat protein
VIELAAFGGAALLLLRKHPHRRLYLFCAAWAFIALSPILLALKPVLYLNGIHTASAIQDRYLYLPSFGFCLIVADLAVVFARGSKQAEIMVWIGTTVVACIYAILLFSAQRLWHDDASLFALCIKRNPQVEFCHARMASLLESQGDLSGARREYNAASELEPDNGANLYNLGVVDDLIGDHRAAAREMTEGLKRIENPPAAGYADLALVADSTGDTSLSEAALERAESLPGGGAPAAVARAQILFRRGDAKGAEDALRGWLRRDPDNADVLATLGLMLSSHNDYDQALEAYRHAAAVAPEEPRFHYLAAMALHRMGRDREARGECAAALEGAPEDANARALMAEIERGGGVR